MIKVHIVNDDDKHIVPRMMKWLVAKYGWSIGPYVDPNVDVNYYAPYTSLGSRGEVNTKTMAWFTHYEEGNKGKENIWYRAERYVDLRCYTVCSDLISQWELQTVLRNPKPFTYLTPGIDQTHFDLATKKRKKNKQPVVGTAGIASARKGLDLFDVLNDNAKKLKLTMSIAGQGWSGAVMYPDGAMPSYYHSLDAYVCLSTIEGIPAPPLESLACGTKVVVPIGVGMLDELPETEGIRHYIAGDYDDMLRALHLVLEDTVTPKALRKYVEKYTIDAWCESHMNAVEKLA